MTTETIATWLLFSIGMIANAFSIYFNILARRELRKLRGFR